MKWSELSLDPAPRTLRQFAGAWLVCLCALGANAWLRRGRPVFGETLILAGLLIGGLGLSWPKRIRWLIVAATVIAFPLGWLISQIVLAFMFYLILTPVAALFRWRGRDLLGLKPMSDRPTFWVEKPPAKSLRNYFRQY